MNNLQLKNNTIKQFAINSKNLYAHNYYMKNKIRKQKYYNDYYKINKDIIKKNMNLKKPSKPTNFIKINKEILINFN